MAILAMENLSIDLLPDHSNMVWQRTCSQLFPGLLPIDPSHWVLGLMDNQMCVTPPHPEAPAMPWAALGHTSGHIHPSEGG